MYQVMNNLLSDKTGRVVFYPFNLWHILYLVLLAGGIIALCIIFSKRSRASQQRLLDGTAGLVFALYMADFFLMPFSYGYIDIDKLPFHVCTLMGILCFVSRRNRFFGKFKTAFAILGFLGGLIYVVYPAGVADGAVSMICYRILQTLTYHGLILAYGVYALVFGDIELKWREFYKDVIVTVGLGLWAVLGNYFYSGVEDGRTFNWFFAVQDPFALIPEPYTPYLTPFLVVAAMLSLIAVIYGVNSLVLWLLNRKKKA